MTNTASQTHPTTAPNARLLLFLCLFGALPEPGNPARAGRPRRALRVR